MIEEDGFRDEEEGLKTKAPFTQSQNVAPLFFFFSLTKSRSLSSHLFLC